MQTLILISIPVPRFLSVRLSPPPPPRQTHALIVCKTKKGINKQSISNKQGLFEIFGNPKNSESLETRKIQCLIQLLHSACLAVFS
jgi:hypothetical protein